VPSRCSNAHPVCVPRSRAKIVVFIVVLQFKGQ